MTLAQLGRFVSDRFRRHERSWHIAGLCAFAFSQPLYAALLKQTVYLHDLEVGWFEIGFLVAVLSFGIPLLWIAADGLAQQLPRRCGRLRSGFLLLLFCLFWMTLLRPFLRLPFLELHYAVWMATLALAIPAAVVSLILYERQRWVRGWISLASIGLIVFPAMFVSQFARLQVLRSTPQATVERPVPIVMVVFDEFSGLTLMDDQRQIDAKSYPNFARLAAQSTWYRQASTVHVRTDVAVPALLSGQYPTVPRKPLASEFPGNLFRRIQATSAYDMTVYEPITRLCPEELVHDVPEFRTRWEKLQLLTQTLWSVYPRLILPNDVPFDLPPISKLWFGLPESFSLKAQIPIGLHRYDPFRRRARQLDQFLASLRRSNRPLFQFLHVELPHMPWCFLPSGNEYDFDFERSFEPLGARGELAEDWGTNAGIVLRQEQRYLLQVGYVDRFIGELLDRLEAIDLLDRCLLIVTADHGVSFQPRHSRRLPDADTLGDLLSIPLFIKWPGKSASEVSDVNVESVDLLPTIAEWIGLPLTEPVDGRALPRSTGAPRKTLFLEEGHLVLEPTIPRMDAAIQRRRRQFEDSGELPPMARAHPEWQGRPVREFAVARRPESELWLAPFQRERIPGVQVLPCLVWGAVQPADRDGDSIELVLAVDGVIRDSLRTFPRRRGLHGFEFLIPEPLYRVEPSRPGDTPQLGLLKQWTLSSTDAPVSVD